MDSAFASRPYPACTTAELQAAVSTGDVSVMTFGERLRFARAGGIA